MLRTRDTHKAATTIIIYGRFPSINNTYKFNLRPCPCMKNEILLRF